MKLNLFGGEGVGKKDQRDFKVLEKKKIPGVSASPYSKSVGRGGRKIGQRDLKFWIKNSRIPASTWSNSVWRDGIKIGQRGF